MIKYIKRKDLDVEKYNYCIENSLQSRIYAFSWYLDIVADNWSVLVLNDYEAVMPIPWKKKYGIKYVTQPLWCLELGVFSLNENTSVDVFLKFITTKFKFIEFRLNRNNTFINKADFLEDKQFQILQFNKDYDGAFNGFRKDRKKDIKKAKSLDLVEKWNDSPQKLITLFKENVGKRTPNITDSNYTVLNKLINTCLNKKVGEVLSIYDKENNLVASGFFLKYQDEITILVSSTDFKNRNNGANSFLIDRAIFKFERKYKLFNFGGSSVKSIAKYFLSFGSETEKYQQINYNNLPFLLRLFKK